MAKYRDYYRLLGVAPDAKDDVIKAAYRKLARKLHPDVNKAPDAQARFIEIGEAYEALGDPAKRAAYDRLRQAGYTDGQEIPTMPPPGQGGGFGGFGGGDGPEGFGSGQYSDVDPEAFSDFFQSLFGQQAGGRGRGRRSQRSAYQERGEDVVHPFAVTLEEAYQGGSRRLTIQMPSVDASGAMTRGSRIVDVKIPAGVTENTKIRLKGQGNPGSSPDQAGDLYLEVHLEPHPLFTVDGLTVHLTVPVAPWEAVLGASVRVPTLGGPVTLTVAPNSAAGTKLRLRGRGLPGTPPGDEIVTLTIVTPSHASEQERELYKNLAAGSTGFNPRAALGT